MHNGRHEKQENQRAFEHNHNLSPKAFRILPILAMVIFGESQNGV
jgi:hypothetical protein